MTRVAFLGLGVMGFSMAGHLAKNGAPLPVAEMVNDFYGEVQQMGGGRWDTSSLIQRLRKN